MRADFVLGGFPSLRTVDVERLMRNSLAAFLVLGWVAMGCPRGEQETTLPIVTTDDAEADAAMREALTLAESGEDEEAEARFRAFLHDYPTDPLHPVADVELGRLLLARGATAEARTHFARVREHEEPALAERALLYEGVTMHLEGESAAALDQLRPLVERTVDPSETALLLQTIAAASERVGDRAGAVLAYDGLMQADVPSEAKDDARAHLDPIIEALTAEELETLFGQLPRSGYAWAPVSRRALREAFAQGELGRVRAIAAALAEERVPLDRELQSIALRAERTGQTDLRAIGAILPLSGRGREVGQLALQALMLGAGLPPDRPPSEETPRVFFRDSAGDAERAARAVDDLVTLHQVVAIVGPVDGRAGRAAARRAQELGVPLISLSPDPTIVEAGDFVFRLFFSPRDEADALVSAAYTAGSRRFAVLRPDHGYGETMSEAFREAVGRIGATWVGETTYEPGATSLGETMAALENQTFDTLIVPDHARQLSVVAPSLAAAGWWSRDPASSATPPEGARPIRLLVPTVGLDGELVRTTGRYLQGSLFSKPFHAPTATGVGREFADAFQQRYQRTPDAYGAAAFDAFQLVRAAVERGATTRAQVREALARSAGTETAGASGGFTSTRQPLRGTRVLMLRGPTLVPATE